MGLSSILSYDVVLNNISFFLKSIKFLLLNCFISLKMVLHGLLAQV